MGHPLYRCARGKVGHPSYCYDGLHRMTGKAYSAQTCQNGQLPVGTAVVSFTYDQGTYGIGRMTSLTDQAGPGSYTYDSMGRISSETRVISGVSKSMSYDYNLDGSVKALHYPSGRSVNYTYNGAARPITAIDANGTQYVSNVTHWPSGDEYQRWMPNIYFNTTLNNRLQISGLYSDNGQTASYYMNKTYSYGTQNNGNVASIVNNKDPNRTATYTHDALNRITSGWSTANTGALSWGENYTIDAWGNLMIAPMGSKAHGGNFQCAGDNSNRATCLSYDSAGNVTANGSAAYSYDQENRLSSTASTTYAYDANGSRVKKSSGSTGTLYFYALPGIIAETDLTGALKSEYVFLGGKRIARIDSPGNSVHYYLSDHLSSTTMVVSAAGVSEEESDYSPYGSEYLVTSNGANHYKFTGKEWDSESGFEQMGARYYSSALGRFVQADPLYIALDRLVDPQQLNLESYVRNSPTVLTDPTGLDVSLKCDSKASCDQAKDDLNGRKGAQFKVALGKNNKLEVVKGSVGKNLSKSEKALLSAIKDGSHHATITVSANSGESEFGEHTGRGTNSIDLGNLSKLDTPSNAGGLNSGDVIAHEAMDAYYSTFMGAAAADQAAAALFPGLSQPANNTNELSPAGTRVIGSTYSQQITDGRGAERISIRYGHDGKTPIPAIDFFGKTPTQQNQVAHDAGSRVTGVTYVPAPKK